MKILTFDTLFDTTGRFETHISRLVKTSIYIISLLEDVGLCGCGGQQNNSASAGVSILQKKIAQKPFQIFRVKCKY